MKLFILLSDITERISSFRYIGVLSVFIILSYIVYTLRYEKSKKSLKKFYRNLRRLEQVGLEGTRKLDETGGNKL